MLFRKGRFRRADRILRTQDFRRVAKSGKRQSSKSFVVMIAPRAKSTVGKSREKQKRLGVTVGKRVGGSVIRNRVKRCIREWFRHAKESLPDGSDTVVIARRTARDLSSREAAAILDGMIEGVWVRRGSPAAAEF